MKKMMLAGFLFSSLFAINNQAVAAQEISKHEVSQYNKIASINLVSFSASPIELNKKLKKEVKKIGGKYFVVTGNTVNKGKLGLKAHVYK